MKVTTKRNPAYFVQRQADILIHAIELLQSDLDMLTGTIDPDTTSWIDVCRFAQSADNAMQLIEYYREIGR